MKRRKLRAVAVQSLYHMEMNEVTCGQAIDTALSESGGLDLWEEEDAPQNAEISESEQQETLRKWVGETHRLRAEIDRLIAAYLQGWKLDRLSKVDKQVLRLAVYELVYLRETPPKVVVNEAIELAKTFGTEESGKFVNGVLGKMMRELPEIRQKAPLETP
jgi:N utilization substance protein B